MRRRRPSAMGNVQSLFFFVFLLRQHASGIDSRMDTSTTDTSVTVDHIKSAAGDLRHKVNQFFDQLDKEISDTAVATEEWNQIQALAKDVRAKAKQKIKIDVGGELFSTSRSTLSNRFPNTIFNVMISTKIWQPEDGVYFLDHDPRFFDVILDYMRDGELHCETVRTAQDAKYLIQDLEYFNIPFTKNETTGLPEKSKPTNTDESENNKESDDDSTLAGAHVTMEPIKSTLKSLQSSTAKAIRDWRSMEATVESLAALAKGKVKIDFGGKLFTTSKATLNKSEWFSAMSERWETDEDGCYFIDRNSRFFGVVLNYLRYGEWRLDDVSIEMRARFRTDLDYFLLADKIDDFDSVLLWPPTCLTQWFPSMSFKLLYRGSRDGFNTAQFHALCDNKGTTITVARAQNLGHVFGGYTTINWSMAGHYVSDPNAFLFRISPPLKSTGQNNQHTCYSAPHLGPCFGAGHDLVFNLSGNSSTVTGCANTFQGFNLNDVVGSRSTLHLEEIEVFLCVPK